jgi:CelD/BcsL family acetyltransferase involved in cellulose biosynthesis
VLSALLDPLHDPRWARLVERSPQGSIFHHPAWLRLLHVRYGYPVAGAVVLDAAGDPIAGLPLALVSSRLTGRRLVALPFSDACPPLVIPEAPDVALRSLADGVERQRLVRGLPLQVCASFPQLGPTVDRFLQHHVDLTRGIEALEGAFAPGARRHVRTAERMGVEIDRRTDADALETFYALHLRTRRRLGVPTQPKGFIRALGTLTGQGLGFVAVARHDRRPIAAAVFLGNERTLTYKYGASDERHLRKRPNNLLFARVMRWASEQGLATLDLGRTDPAQAGLAAFKRSLGATEGTLGYTYRGMAPSTGAAARLERISTTIIRNSPPLVGRAIGEALYRHAG